jgi:hypothetical protein
MIEGDYKIISVEPVEAPPDMAGTGWHRYVIGQGSNRIHGYRQGSIVAVRQSVEEIVLRLNERRIVKRARIHLDLSSRGKPASRK